MAASDNHYYVPEKSALAFCTATSVAIFILGFAAGLNSMTFGDGGGFGWELMVAGLLAFLSSLFVWFKTAIDENRQGLANAQLKRSYVLGMQWFIFSEVMFFAAFFGTLFYIRQFALPWLAGEGNKSPFAESLLWQGFENVWPLVNTPQDVVGVEGQYQANNGVFPGARESMGWQGLPLINTILLLTSSLTLHFAHSYLLTNNRGMFNLWLGATLVLGFVFVGCQVLEYKHAYSDLGLTLEAGIYGSTFFILTGFHGFHVCMGATMLLVQYLRSTAAGHFDAEDHFGFEMAAWYWHFVDVVWVGLFLFVYIF